MGFTFFLPRRYRINRRMQKRPQVNKHNPGSNPGAFLMSARTRGGLLFCPGQEYHPAQKTARRAAQSPADSRTQQPTPETRPHRIPMPPRGPQRPGARLLFYLYTHTTPQENTAQDKQGDGRTSKASTSKGNTTEAGPPTRTGSVPYQFSRRNRVAKSSYIGTSSNFALADLPI